MLGTSLTLPPNPTHTGLFLPLHAYSLLHNPSLTYLCLHSPVHPYTHLPTTRTWSPLKPFSHHYLKFCAFTPTHPRSISLPRTPTPFRTTPLPPTPTPPRTTSLLPPHTYTLSSTHHAPPPPFNTPSTVNAPYRTYKHRPKYTHSTLFLHLQ